jgi:DNA-binding NarL/FixJ family response regulator
MENNDAAVQLGAVGFDDKSVAEMVGISESTVRGVRFRRSKKRPKKTKTR